LVFFPGKTPESTLGRFRAVRGHIHRDYENFIGLEAYDVAILKMKKGSNGFPNAGRTVQEAAGGSLGYKVNSAQNEWASTGYPSGVEYGRDMWTDKGILSERTNPDYPLTIIKTKQHHFINDRGVSGGQLIHANLSNKA